MPVILGSVDYRQKMYNCRDLKGLENDGTQNHPFCRLQLLVETFKHLT